MQRTNAIPERRLAAAAILLAGAMVVPGCLVTAATVAIVHIARSNQGETAVVEIPVAPREVYAAMLRILKNDSTIVLEGHDEAKMTVSVSRGTEKAVGSVKPMADGHAEFTVKAVSPEGREKSTDLARRAVTRVCKELGFTYKVTEQ